MYSRDLCNLKIYRMHIYRMAHVIYITQRGLQRGREREGEEEREGGRVGRGGEGESTNPFILLSLGSSCWHDSPEASLLPAGHE